MRDLTIYIYWIYRIMNQTSSKCDSATESLPSFHQLPESHHAVCRRLEAHASAGCGTASKPRFSPPIARIFHHESALDICLSSVKTCQNEETNDKKGMKPEHFARPHQHSQGRLNLIIQRMHRHRATQR